MKKFNKLADKRIKENKNTLEKIKKLESKLKLKMPKGKESKQIQKILIDNVNSNSQEVVKILKEDNNSSPDMNKENTIGLDFNEWKQLEDKRLREDFEKLNICECGHEKENHGDSIYKGDCFECGKGLVICNCFKKISFPNFCKEEYKKEVGE